MKKLLIIPLIVISSGLFAQNFQFGLKAGANISNFTNTSFNNFDNKAVVGFHGGAFLSLLLGNHLAIQPEAMISTTGAKLNNAANVAENGDYKLTYLAVPVMLKGRFNGGFYLEAGPQFGFKLSENVPDNTIDNFAKDLDVGVAAGLGFHGKSGLGIGGRYVLGLSDVGDFDASEFDNPSFRNGVIQLSLFYTFLNNKNNP
jgi:hypothetical protein